MPIVRSIQRWIFIFLLVAIAIPIAAIDLKPQSQSTINPPARAIPASLFGMHIHHALENWPNVPFSQWRLWDAYVTWGDLEPEPGAWKFELLDRYVELATKHKVEILLTLGQTPRWAAARPNDESAYGNPGWPAEPANLKDWRNYVRTVATRYRGKIRYYEIWNEPDLKSFYSGSVEKMVELAQAAHTVLKQVDPQIYVLSPGATNGTPNFQWQQDYFRRGGGKYADAIAQHFYPNSAFPEDLGKSITQMKAVMSKAGLAKKPLWNTESGWLKPGEIAPERKAMAQIARTYLINWASGVQRFYWYAWDNQTAVSLHLTKSDGKKLTPVTNVTNSYTQIQQWLVGAKMQTCAPNSAQAWVCNFTRKGQAFWIVWHPDREMTFNVPKNWQVRTVRDLYGKSQPLAGSGQIPIDFAPVLLSPTKQS
jgi:Glycosyl hydrolase catalytic core